MKKNMVDVDPMKEFIKFETIIYLNEDDEYCCKKTLISKSENLSEYFLDELWENDDIEIRNKKIV